MSGKGEWHYVGVDHVSEPRSTDVLHVALQEHIRGCDTCKRAVEDQSPAGFGKRTRMCEEYLNLVQIFADGVEL